MTVQKQNNPVVKDTSQDSIVKYLGDKQDPVAIKKAYKQVMQILTTNEEILYIAVQKPLMPSLSPDSAVLTSKRFIIFRPKVFGGASFQDYIWRDLHDAHLEEGRTRSTFTLKTVGNKRLRIGDLPKEQARKLYAFSQEREEAVREERRNRDMEEKRAAAGGVFLQSPPAYQTPQTPPPQTPPAPQEDPLEKLKKLKAMMDADLITAQEYEVKKTDILSRM